jgi:hypothetical protein
MLPSRISAFAPLFGLCLAALAGCSNPAIEPEAPKPGAPAAGSGSVVQPQPVAAAGGTAPVIPVVSAAGSAAVVAGSSAPNISAGAGSGAAGTAGTAAGAGGSLAAASGGAGGAAEAAAGRGGNAGAAGGAGASGSDPDDWLPIIGDDTTNPNPPAADSCSDLFCFDVLDCAIFHPDESATCNFTACENFVCK